MNANASGPSKPPPPTRLGRYDVRAKIADGGMATIYVGRVAGARQASSVALKVIKDEFSLNPEFVNMFLDEAKIVANLVHPNIIRLHELGVEGQRLFIAMELLFGQSLWDVWDACRARKVRLRYDTVAWIGARVADGLHHAHELHGPDGRSLDVVHRDVNATNIFITYDGQVKVIDFGLAKARNRVSRTAAGIIKGKTAYMSPEQAIGHALDRRTDVFALGTTLWELTVDQRLFKQPDDVETLKRVYKAEVPDPTLLVDGYPPELWSILRVALAREREDRFESAGALSAALDRYAGRAGRAIAEAEVAEVMQALFAEEKQRQAEWLVEASAADGPAPRSTMKPPSLPLAGADATSVAPPAFPLSPSQVDATWARAPAPHGLFAPPPSRPAAALPAAARQARGVAPSVAEAQPEPHPHAPKTALSSSPPAPARPSGSGSSSVASRSPSSPPAAPALESQPALRVVAFVAGVGVLLGIVAVFAAVVRALLF